MRLVFSAIWIAFFALLVLLERNPRTPRSPLRLTAPGASLRAARVTPIAIPTSH